MQSGGAYLWSITLGFVFGIALRSHVALGSSTKWWLCILAVAFVGATYMQRRSLAQAGIILAFVLAMLAGMIRVESAHVSPDSYIQEHIGKEIVLRADVIAEPDVRESSVRVTLGNIFVASTSAQIQGRILAIVPPFTHVAYGEQLVLRGVVALPERFETGPGREFDYPGYLAVSGVSALLERTVLHESHAAPWTFVGTIIALKQAYVQGIAAALPEPHASLGAGITAGEKRGLGKEVSSDFRAVSLTHIIVLSGYNITIVASALAFLLAGRAPFVRFGAGALVAIFFVAMTGGAAASVRAGIMALIGMAAQGSGRIYLASRALAVAIACMAAWNPLVVAFDPGFQLSILATAGLIWLAPLIEPLYRHITERWHIREIAVSSTAAQIAVLPLLLYQSGMFSFAALPANLLALIAVPAAMLATSIAGLIGILFPLMAPLAGLPAYVLLSYILGIAQQGAKVPLSQLQLPEFSVGIVFGIYMCMGIVVWWNTQTKTAAKGGGFRSFVS